MAISNLTTGLRSGVCTSTTRPSAPYEGQMIYETDTDKVLVWNGTAWVIPNAPAQNPTGLELVTTATCTSGGTASNGVITVGSAVSSVVVGNAFSSTYTDYKVIYSGGSMSNDVNISMRLGSNTANYYGSFIYSSYNNTTISAAKDENVAQWSWIGGGTYSTINVDIFRPNLAQWTDLDARVRYDTYWGRYQGLLVDTAQYTSFTIFPSFGTITGGTIRVYGYRK